MTTQTAADITEIRNLIARIAIATDIGDPGEFTVLYASDATLQMRVVPDIPPDVGIDAILAGSRKRRTDGITGPGSGLVHAIQASAVTLSGDEASAKTYVILYRNAIAAPQLSGLLVYNDAFKRTPDGWRLSLRYIDPVPAR